MRARIAVSGCNGLARAVAGAALERRTLALVAVDGRDVQAEAGPGVAFADPQAGAARWNGFDVDVVVACDGDGVTHPPIRHLEAGARRVVVAGPMAEADVTVLAGLNDGSLEAEHRLIAAGGALTNCVAPVLFTLHRTIGIEQAVAVAVGAEGEVDAAARAVGDVLPELAGKIAGLALPAGTGTAGEAGLLFHTMTWATIAQVDGILRHTAAHDLAGLIGVEGEASPKGRRPVSAVYRPAGTGMVDGRLGMARLAFDPGRGFALRLLDLAAAAAALDRR